MVKSRGRRTVLLPRTAGRDAAAQISDRQRSVLRSLAAYDKWARPMDIGGRDGSHHTMTLRTLVKKGLAERKLRGSLLNQIRSSDLYERLAAAKKRGRSAPRGSYEYRITGAGREVLGL